VESGAFRWQEARGSVDKPSTTFAAADKSLFTGTEGMCCRSAKEKKQIRTTLTPPIIRALYKGVSGNEASLKYIRKCSEEGELHEKDLSLTYGEIVPSSFHHILDYVSSSNLFCDEPFKEKNGIFYDLGCGTGRAVICAALSPHLFRKVIGIEIIPDLHENAVEIRSCLLSAIALSCSDLSKSFTRSALITETKSKQKVMEKLSKVDLIEKVTGIIILRSSTGVCSQEFVCNELTKQIGHKLYRLSLQPYGKFSKFLSSCPENFTLSEGDQVTVAASPQAVTDCVEVLDETILDENCTNLNIHDSPQSVEILTNESVKSEAQLKEEKVHALTSALMSIPNAIEAISPLPDIEFILNDIFECCWYEDADVVYVASLLFTDKMMLQLSQQALKMKRGSWLISLKPLIFTNLENSGKIILRDKSYYKMSWQMAEVFFYQTVI
jgi:hypothetical protein